MYKRFLLPLLAWLFMTSIAVAQDAPRPFVINNSQIIPIQSKYTGRAHELVVVLPASYASHPEKTYPVLYFADAYWDTPLLSSLHGNLIYDNVMPETIMVGLSYPTGANYDLERRIDYTATPDGENSGKAREFLDFIQKEVAPLIESRYRGRKEDRIIGGNSLGGHLAIAAAYLAPGFFTSHIAISPAVAWDHGSLFKIDEAFAKTGKPLQARMFISYGSNEYPAFREPIARFQKLMAKRAYRGLAVQNYVMQGLDHTAVKGDGYVRGLIWAWKPKKPAGPSGLEKAMTAQK